MTEPHLKQFIEDHSGDTEHDRLARSLLAVHSVTQEHPPLLRCHAQAAVLLKQGWGQLDLAPARIEAMADLLRERADDRRDGWEYILAALLLTTLEFPR